MINNKNKQIIKIIFLLNFKMDDLLDPLGDRVMKNVPPIARFPLKRDQLWHKSGKISIHLYIPNPILNLLNIIFELK